MMMKKKNLFNYICLLLVMITVSLEISSETPLSAYAASAADKSNAIWDEEFEGGGSVDITFRSYLDFYIYDYDTKAFLGIIKMDKKAGGSSIDGEYVVKYNGKDLICRLEHRCERSLSHLVQNLQIISVCSY